MIAIATYRGSITHLRGCKADVIGPDARVPGRFVLRMWSSGEELWQVRPESFEVTHLEFGRHLVEL